MAHDNSAASRLEDWIVTTLEAAATADGITVDVRPFAGSIERVAQRQVAEVIRYDHVTIQVFCAGEDDRQDAEATLLRNLAFPIIIAVKNDAGDGAAARRGDGTKVGINRLRELVIEALHDVHPGTQGSYKLEPAKVSFFRSGWEEKGLWIVVGEVVIPVVPPHPT